VKEEILAATLAGLLHDVGKFAQRSGLLTGAHADIGGQLLDQAGWRDWLPRFAWEDVADAVASHHAKSSPPHKRIEKIVRAADRLAAGERRQEAVPKSEPAEAPLVPVLGQVSLTSAARPSGAAYGLRPLSADRATLFPTGSPQGVTREGYGDLWRSLEAELVQLAKSGPVESDLRLATLLALLRKYLWCIPSATPWQTDEDDRTLPDVSLFDHAKVTAALAACLAAGLTDDELDDLYRKGEDWPLPVALMVRGDFSGIQNFIYRITRPEATAEFEHVAKRLRGRSFYLGLIGDVVADFLIRSMGLSAVNVLFLGGGRFDLLVPVDSRTAETLENAIAIIEQWLLTQFTGDLGLQLVTAEVRASDLGNMRPVYDLLETRVRQSKQRRWARYLLKDDFHLVPRDAYHACRVCHTTSLDEPGICDMCGMQAALGKKLPHATHLAMLYGGLPPDEGLWMDDFEPAFGVRVGLLEDDEAAALRKALGRQASGTANAMLSRLNDTDFLPGDAPRGLGMSFRFLANAAPLAKETLRGRGFDPVEAGDVLHFEAIAELSTGAKRLGVLKADVDHLGLIMSEGLDDGHPGGLRPTISRIATLSSAVDLFFAGWLNELCSEVAHEWRASRPADPSASAQRLAELTDGAFYVMYSGGDDLFIIGPWDAVMLLAGRLREAWTDYGCGNPNVTISAGMVLVKPRYPVQRFAEEVSEALEVAKSAGRNRISVFDQAVAWTEGDLSYDSLLQLGRDLRQAVTDGSVPSTLVYDLGRLERAHRDPTEKGGLKPMFTPRLYYTLARRLAQTTRENFTPRILKAMRHVQIPVSYVSLSTREE
jgi:CRISPR-associated protein Csm1